MTGFAVCDPKPIDFYFDCGMIELRDAFHEQLKDYIIPLTKKDYDYFLGKDSQTIYDLMQQNQDVLKRLKERE